MLKGIVVPNTVCIKNEYFFSFLVAEDHLRVEGVDVEHQRSRKGISFNLFEVSNIYSVSDDCSEVRSFVENDLLSVGEEFGVESEVLDGS